MSTTNIPTSWQDALENHSISSVRAFEKQLRTSALRDKEKLRALVGSNYRELLATAEQIVELNVQTRDAEANISSLSEACKPPSYGRDQERFTHKTELACQLRLLDVLLRCASSAIKQRAVLLSSKIIVIARLLVKHVEDKHGLTRTIHWLQTRLKKIRLKSSHQIDGLLLRPSTPLSILVQSLGAHCLLTSTSSVDAMKHFQDLCLQRLASFEDISSNVSHLRQSCHYLIASVVAIKALSGRVVTDLLNELQRHPILQSSEILKTEPLQLDINQDFLPPDIVSFTPYFRRVAPSKAELQSNLQQWVEAATNHLVHRITSTLSDVKLVKTLRMRQEVLEILLPNCFSASLHMTVLNSIRGVFSKTIVGLIEQHVRELGALGQKLGELRQAEKDNSLWSSHLIQASTTKRTTTYLRGIHRLHLGVRSDLEKYFQYLRRWLQRFNASKEALQHLARVRWQDKLEEYDDDDEEIAREIVVALSKDDSQTYLGKLNSTLQLETENLIRKVGEQTARVVEDVDGDEKSNDSSRITLMLRAVREMHFLLKSLLPTGQFPELLESTTKLHVSLAQTVAREFSAITEKADGRVISTTVAEDLPSPLLISVLQNLCLVMLKHGGHDLWNAAAVRQVGKFIYKRAISADTKHFYIRNDFDEQYISIALGVRSPEQATTETEKGWRKANAYWSRTKALFGVLNI